MSAKRTDELVAWIEEALSGIRARVPSDKVKAREIMSRLAEYDSLKALAEKGRRSRSMRELRPDRRPL